MTKNQACDRALAAIGKVLNIQDDEGRYIFGGVSSNDQPCVDLTAFSNLDSAGNILNNYTTATPNLKTITVADGVEIQVGLDASNQAFATLIGAINRLKASANAVPTVAELTTLDTELNKGILGIDSIETTIISNQTDLANAEKSTNDKYIKATDLLNSDKFKLSTEELVQKMIEYLRSEKVLQSIQGINNKISSGLVDILNRMS